MEDEEMLKVAFIIKCLYATKEYSSELGAMPEDSCPQCAARTCFGLICSTNFDCALQALAV